ncbi:MAG: cell envelope integrity protein CreD [Rubrivivax sp.]|nr:cell envelope integrity protein CreD [Rubrivivax sp.]
MRFPLLSKVLAVGLVMLLMAAVLARIGWLVDERQGRRQQAVASVKESVAAAQALLGPIVQRRCTEHWQRLVGEGRDRRSEPERRNFVLQATPETLAVDGQLTSELRYRGIYKVHGYNGQIVLDARWDDLAALQPRPEHTGSTIECETPTVVFAVTDPRGLRGAEVVVDGQPMRAEPGTGDAVHPQGLKVRLTGRAGNAGMVGTGGTVGVPGTAGATGAAGTPGMAVTSGAAGMTGGPAPAPLAVKLTLQLAGTDRLALVPAAASTRWRLRADWPHPSFGGRFLPERREIGATGFDAQWTVSSLASDAARAVVQGAPLCGLDALEGRSMPPRAATDKPRASSCLDTLSVNFFDPVDVHVLADRAIKYGMLFVVFTFMAVGLVEVLARRRVHPVQYALVGMALCLFFLLLLSLSEHVAFDIAYAAASGACAGVLAVYGAFMLGSRWAGAGFGAGVAALYGMLYVLLQQEQRALVIGSIALFVALAAVMWLTRRVDWYARFEGISRAAARPAQA